MLAKKIPNLLGETDWGNNKPVLSKRRAIHPGDGSDRSDLADFSGVSAGSGDGWCVGSVWGEASEVVALLSWEGGEVVGVAVVSSQRYFQAGDRMPERRPYIRIPDKLGIPNADT
jgi:hypothetical protein